MRLTSSEAQGAEILATLQNKDDDGITLSDIGELGPGPTMFCLWDAVRDVRLQSAASTPFYGDEEVGILPYEELEEPTEIPKLLR